MHTIRRNVSEQCYQLRAAGTVPRRVKLGLREQAILDAPSSPKIAGAQSPFQIDPLTSKQTFMGLEVRRVLQPTCLEVEG